MDIVDWLQRLEWSLVILATLVAICVVFLFCYVVRAPRWFSGRRDREDLRRALHEILDRHHAAGGITREQHDEIKRILAGGARLP